MSVVIIGGHDRMVRQYQDICKSYRCKAKVFTQMTGDLKKQIGRPDLCVLFGGSKKEQYKDSEMPHKQQGGSGGDS